MLLVPPYAPKAGKRRPLFGLLVWLLALAFLMPTSRAESWRSGQRVLFPETTASEGLSGTVGNESAPETRNEQGILSRFAGRLSQTWQSPVWDLYLPLYTWHNRLTYDSSHIRRYNELPWGGGFGKSFADEDGDRHFLYLMGFQDSHNMFEPIAGYAFQKNRRLDAAGDWRLGLGYTMAITARQQYGYIPLPLVLPLAAVEYKRLALQGVYIPGTRNNGNVLFLWLRWQLTE